MTDFRKILILDCAMNGCVTAVYADGVCHTERFETSRGQAEKLIPMVQDALRAAGCGFDDLDAVIVTLGPGAFTGIRIGISAAKTLAMVLGVPLFGISVLQALALDYNSVCNVILETKRSDFYFQGFSEGANPLGVACCVMLDDVAPEGIFIGDAAQRLARDVNVQVQAGYEAIQPDVIAAAFLDEARRAAFFTQDIAPIYLRAPDVSAPKNKPRQVAQ
ncbi:MAG: tRNA (adenosine(37)-N6)-threonylcarbamoyltransferase complex dimerization subunit type 1 TsaB [Alphaproteobacteria bacterium]